MVAEGGKRTPASEFAVALYPKPTKANPSTVIYKGSMASAARILSSVAWFFGPRFVDLSFGGVNGLNDLAKIVRARENKERREEELQTVGGIN